MLSPEPDALVVVVYLFRKQTQLAKLSSETLRKIPLACEEVQHLGLLRLYCSSSSLVRRSNGTFVVAVRRPLRRLDGKLQPAPRSRQRPRRSCRRPPCMECHAMPMLLLLPMLVLMLMLMHVSYVSTTFGRSQGRCHSKGYVGATSDRSRGRRHSEGYVGATSDRGRGRRHSRGYVSVTSDRSRGRRRSRTLVPPTHRTLAMLYMLHVVLTTIHHSLLQAWR